MDIKVEVNIQMHIYLLYVYRIISSVGYELIHKAKFLTNFALFVIYISKFMMGLMSPFKLLHSVPSKI